MASVSGKNVELVEVETKSGPRWMFELPGTKPREFIAPQSRSYQTTKDPNDALRFEEEEKARNAGRNTYFLEITN